MHPAEVYKISVKLLSRAKINKKEARGWSIFKRDSILTFDAASANVLQERDELLERLAVDGVDAQRLKGFVNF